MSCSSLIVAFSLSDRQLFSNQLTGTIPPELGNLPLLSLYNLICVVHSFSLTTFIIFNNKIPFLIFDTSLLGMLQLVSEVITYSINRLLLRHFLNSCIFNRIFWIDWIMRLGVSRATRSTAVLASLHPPRLLQACGARPLLHSGVYHSLSELMVCNIQCPSSGSGLLSAKQ